MKADALDRLAAVDWDDAAPRLLEFARRWAGALYGWQEGQMLPNGMGTEDVVKDAVAAFANGERTLNPDFEVVVQIKGAIRSILWNIHRRRSAELTRSHEPAFFDTQCDERLNPGSAAASEDFCRNFIHNLLRNGRIKASNELTAVVKAYAEGAESVDELVQASGLPKTRVYELRRELKHIAVEVLRTMNREGE